MEIKKRRKHLGLWLLLGLAFLLGLALLATRGNGSKRVSKATDLETLRAELRAQVKKGDLTKLEAQVRLAEGFAAAKKKERSNSQGKGDPGLQALGVELRAQVAAGGLTPQEAKAKWTEAAKKARATADTKQ